MGDDTVGTEWSARRRRFGLFYPAGSAILVEPGGHSGIPLAETVGRNGDPIADRETPFGHRDYLARVAWHLGFLVCSKKRRSDVV
jgi:hypothetical protein